jgi:PhnB protein
MQTPIKTPIVQSYLTFGGRTEEALAFYATAIGAKTEMIMKFKEAPEPPPADMVPPNWGDKVMHSSFRVGETVLMASDGCGEGGCGNGRAFGGFSLSLSVATEAEARRTFDALAAGGKVTMPLNQTFWSPCFGMVEDKFGINWMVIVPPNPAN